MGWRIVTRGKCLFRPTSEWHVNRQFGGSIDQKNPSGMRGIGRGISAWSIPHFVVSNTAYWVQ